MMIYSATATGFSADETDTPTACQRPKAEVPIIGTGGSGSGSLVRILGADSLTKISVMSVCTVH